MGRVIVSPVMSVDGKILFEAGYLLSEKDLDTLIDNEVDQIKVRSVLVMKGMDFVRLALVETLLVVV